MEREGVPPVDVNRSSKAPRKGALPWIIFGTTLAVTFLLGMLVVSVMERRWEAVKPALVAAEIGEWETDNAVWGRNYPREYESFLQTEETETRTKFGGAYPRDYLDEDPRQVVPRAQRQHSNLALRGLRQRSVNVSFTFWLALCLIVCFQWIPL